MMVKLSDETVAKFGATNAADFNAKLLAFVGSCEESMKAQDDYKLRIEALEKGFSEQAEKLKASADVSEKVSALEKSVEAINPEELTKKAEAAGSRAAATALGKTGAAGAGSIASNPTAEDVGSKPKDFAAIVADYVAAGKTKSDAVLAAIQSNPKEYVAARSAGNIKL